MSITLDGTNGITTPDVTSTGLTADTTTLVVDDVNDRVGIGTSSPAANLHVNSGSANEVARFESTDAGAYISIKDSATTGLNAISGNGDSLSFTVGSERMRIDSIGNLLVGTTSENLAGSEGIKIRPAGDGANNPRIGLVTAANNDATSLPFSIYSTGAAAWRMYVGSTGQIYSTSTTITSISDRRFKENIRDLDDGLNVVMALKPRKFDWKEGQGRNTKNDRGWIADEFKEVVPDLVGTWGQPDEQPEGEAPYESVRPDLIPVLVKAIQEQQAIIEEQQQAITSLQADVAALKGTA